MTNKKERPKFWLDDLYAAVNFQATETSDQIVGRTELADVDKKVTLAKMNAFKIGLEFCFCKIVRLDGKIYKDWSKLRDALKTSMDKAIRGNSSNNPMVSMSTDEVKQSVAETIAELADGGDNQQEDKSSSWFRNVDMPVIVSGLVQFTEANPLERPIKMHKALATLLGHCYDAVEATFPDKQELSPEEFFGCIAGEVFVSIESKWLEVACIAASYVAEHSTLPSEVKGIFKGSDSVVAILRLRFLYTVRVIEDILGDESTKKFQGLSDTGRLVAALRGAIMKEFFTIECHIPSAEAWVKVWTFLVASCQSHTGEWTQQHARATVDQIIARFSISTPPGLLKIKSDESAVAIKAESLGDAVKRERAPGDVQEAEHSKLSRLQDDLKEAARWTVEQLYTYIEDEVVLDSGTLAEKNQALGAQLQSPLLTYNIKVDCRFMKLLIASLQANLWELLFKSSTADSCLDKLTVDVTDKIGATTVTATTLEGRMRLNLIGTIGTERVGNGYLMTSLFGIPLYINPTGCENLLSDIFVPAWSVDVVVDEPSANMRAIVIDDLPLLHLDIKYISRGSCVVGAA